MVPGLKSFKESFSDFMEQYVIIGGAACDIYMESEDGSFRATKDLDIVLIVEALTPEFVSKFWQYVQTAGYQHIDKSKQKPEFYRFSKPISKEYPAMIELFSRPPYNVELSFAANVVPIHVDDSSAIRLPMHLGVSGVFDFLPQRIYNICNGTKRRVEDESQLSRQSRCKNSLAANNRRDNV